MCSIFHNLPRWSNFSFIFNINDDVDENNDDGDYHWLGFHHMPATSSQLFVTKNIEVDIFTLMLKDEETG